MAQCIDEAVHGWNHIIKKVFVTVMVITMILTLDIHVHQACSCYYLPTI